MSNVTFLFCDLNRCKEHFMIFFFTEMKAVNNCHYCEQDSSVVCNVLLHLQPIV